MEYAF